MRSSLRYVADRQPGKNWRPHGNGRTGAGRRYSETVQEVAEIAGSVIIVAAGALPPSAVTV